MEKTRSKTPLMFFACALVLSIVAVFLLVKKCSSDKPNAKDSPATTENGGLAKPNGDTDALDSTGGPNDEDVQSGPSGTAEDLVGRILEVTIQANDMQDAQPLIALIGQQNLTPQQIRKLTELAAASRLKLDPSKPFSREPEATNRWSLNLADNSKIYVELAKTVDGKWQVSNISLAEAKAMATKDPAGDIKPQVPAKPAQDASAGKLVKQFMDAIIRLDPAAARELIDESKVSYATLAGLCIIFEEGAYGLMQQKALRKMFHRETASGWIVRLKSADTGETAMFAINMKRKDAQTPWKVTEINLDHLLTDYAKRILDGDIHYSPLIRNPKGGDTLAIYFDLDAKDLTPRTKRQLTIVANLLRTDKKRKLTISGHADALGPDQYNLSLSRERAEQVVNFLAESGLRRQQMNIEGYGESKPRLPNVTDEGVDSPEGRRANRRAEILLDF